MCVCDGSWGKYLAAAADSGQLWESQMWLFVKEAEEEGDGLLDFIRTKSKHKLALRPDALNAALKTLSARGKSKY